MELIKHPKAKKIIIDISFLNICPLSVCDYLQDILNLTIQSSADFQENLRGDVAVAAHLSDRRWAGTGLCAKILFLHALIHKQFSELFITDSHKNSPPYRYTQKRSAA